MLKRTRRILFYSLSLLFFILGSSAILYAQGWRFDLAHGKFGKVGGIFVQSAPADAAIMLDGRAVTNDSWLLHSGTLINNLFPRTYALALAKQGYLPWMRHLAVLPALVSEARDAVLIPGPSSRTEAPTSTPLSFFADSPALLAAAAEARGSGLLAPGDTPIGAPVDATVILQRGSSFLLADLAAETTSTIAFTRRGAAQALAPDGRGGVLALRPRSITEIPQGNPSGARILETLPATGNDAFAPLLAVSPSSFAWARVNAATGTSTVELFDQGAATSTSSFELPSPPAALRWNGGMIAALGANGDLFTYTPGDPAPAKRASRVRTFAFSADGADLAVAEGSAFEVIPLRDSAARDYRRFNLPGVASLVRLAWYRDGRHLFLVYAAHTDFLDLDDLALEDVARVAETDAVSYDPAANTLYYQDSGKIMQAVFPR